jgi:hypothetical protein
VVAAAQFPRGDLTCVLTGRVDGEQGLCECGRGPARVEAHGDDRSVAEIHDLEWRLDEIAWNALRHELDRPAWHSPP